MNLYRYTFDCDSDCDVFTLAETQEAAQKTFQAWEDKRHEQYLKECPWVNETRPIVKLVEVIQLENKDGIYG